MQPEAPTSNPQSGILQFITNVAQSDSNLYADAFNRLVPMLENQQRQDFELKKEESQRETMRAEAEILIKKRKLLFSFIISFILAVLSAYAIHSGHVEKGGIMALAAPVPYISFLPGLKQMFAKSRSG